MNAYADNLRKAITGVFGDVRYGDRYFDISSQLQANVSRFAAYKAFHVSEQIARQLANPDGVARSAADYRRHAKIVMDTFNQYQEVEYNTAIARARTAKQWIDFNGDPLKNQLYPNLKWLPSRSADPREEHIRFYGLVLPKNHPFWNENQPGNLWNCKCDWEQSAEPASTDKIPSANIAKGLEENPGVTGEVFTDNAAYFKAAEKVNDRVLGDILDLGEKAFLTQETEGGATIGVHLLHSRNEIVGNMDVANTFLKGRSDVKKIELLPIVTKTNIAKRAEFYPKGKTPRGKYNNADAVITFAGGEQWVADFKYMQGNGRNLYRTLREEAYEQAEYAIIKIKGNNVDRDDVKAKADKFLKQYRKFKGVVVYDEKGAKIYEGI